MNERQMPEPSEYQEQVALIRWAEYNKCAHPELKLLMHIPNGGQRGKAEAGRFKAMGVKPGVPDLFLPVARGGKHGLWIELKRASKGKMSSVQKGWILALREQGYQAGICHGWLEASEAILAYLRGDAGEQKQL